MPFLAITTGLANIAIGSYSMFGNTTGNNNTAVGTGALDLNTGNNNTAVGTAALLLNTTGGDNTAVGVAALELNSTGITNTANGAFALFNITTGNGNIALGANAGLNLTTGDDNIDIGNIGVAGESSMIRIGDPAVHEGIFLGGITPMTPEAPNQAVLVDPTTGQLGSVDVGSLLEYAIVTVFVDRGSGPSRWAFYSAPLGSPAGTTTGGVFRFSCSADQAPCKISYGAAVVSNQPAAYCGDPPEAGDPQVSACAHRLLRVRGRRQQQRGARPDTASADVGGRRDGNANASHHGDRWVARLWQRPAVSPQG